ncbi:helix-turn-helix transcriptional regulator [Streptomyces sp. H27-C3]|uniref:helix-turn-helix domain-containing protein n=1 Tax=Streptomyces sp. H27-C3 TaxID=3046305 RepID=UPI0024BAFEB7|nr:helix-turn-helix transcriptional regulator [Streptomyces sp. H27-C3]MDJ0465116.1 helix-turn-helix transcriptional regulator [Streptomyces sp. H27-C3]
MTSHVPNEARLIRLRPAPAAKEPLWRDVVGGALRRERLAQQRTLKDVADEARISMAYLSELERGHKEASSEVLAAAARALGLGLSDLLDLSGAELARLDRAAQPRPRTRVTSTGHAGIGHAGPGSRPDSRQGEVRLAA